MNSGNPQSRSSVVQENNVFRRMACNLALWILRQCSARSQKERVPPAVCIVAPKSGRRVSVSRNTYQALLNAGYTEKELASRPIDRANDADLYVIRAGALFIANVPHHLPRKAGTPDADTKGAA
jgi:hypothetical protein